MPELPEVETINVGLRKLIVNKTIKSISTDWVKSLSYDAKYLKDNVLEQSINRVDRRGKLLIIRLGNKYRLLIHLKMTGQLVYKDQQTRFGAGHPNDSLINDLPDKSTRVIIQFSDNSFLYFNDQRKFGWIKIVNPDEFDNFSFLNTLGPEPLLDSFKASDFKRNILKRPNSEIKAVLLDQKIIAGIGNIYADESLWLAKIHPKSKVNRLSDQKIKDLFNAMQQILRLSITNGGSSDRNYVNAEGKKGNYLEFANVYKRDKQLCPRCKKANILKIRVASRGTHLCPNCQKVQK